MNTLERLGAVRRLCDLAADAITDGNEAGYVATMARIDAHVQVLAGRSRRWAWLRVGR